MGGRGEGKMFSFLAGNLCAYCIREVCVCLAEDGDF